MAAVERHGRRVSHRGTGRCSSGALRLRATGFDTDQGSQFTSPRFTQALPDAAVKVWVDGRAPDGQRHDRAAMAVPETRLRLPARLRNRVRGTGGHRQVDRRSQHRAPTLRARRTDRGPPGPRSEGGTINRQAWQRRQPVREPGATSGPLWRRISMQPCARFDDRSRHAEKRAGCRTAAVVCVEPTGPHLPNT